MVSQHLHSEDSTMVWTDEIRKAFFIAAAIEADPVASRMAFKEAYSKAVAESRERGAPVVWEISLGWSKEGREPVIMDAVNRGRISMEYATKFLPPPPAPALPNLSGMRMLTA